MPIFTLGGQTKERVEVEIHGYERSPVGDYYDDNWLRASVSVSAGAFLGKYSAAFLTSELLGFREELQMLYHSCQGTARFSTLEEQLSLLLCANRCGGILLKGMAVDAPGTGNRLEFELSLDQSYLAPALEELTQIIARFPVRASL